MSIVFQQVESPTKRIDAAAYREYRPLLFGALKQLADRGFAIPFDEGLDLIHEFFLDAWPGLMTRFDPRRAQLRTYVFGAFVQFARPRILRLARWRQAASFELDTLVDDDVADTGHLFDVRRLAQALEQLSDDDRELLEARLGAGESERALATRLGTTRYQIRERSVEALAKVVAMLGDSSLLDARDSQLLQALWGDGKTPDEVAAALGMAPTQVRARKQKILSALQRAFPTTTTTTTNQGHPHHGKEEAMELCDIWTQLCESPTEESVRIARSRAEALAEHLDICPACIERIPKSDKAIDAAYRALSGDQAPVDAKMDELMQLRASIDDDVRKAVSDVLAERLSTDLRQRLRQLDSLKVYGAIEGFSLLLQRETRGTSPYATLTPQGLRVAEREPLPLELVIGEIRVMAAVEDSAARTLFHWVRDATRVVPQLVPGAIASAASEGDDIRFQVVKRPRVLDLARQWAPA